MKEIYIGSLKYMEPFHYYAGNKSILLNLSYLLIMNEICRPEASLDIKKHEKEDLNFACAERKPFVFII